MFDKILPEKSRCEGCKHSRLLKAQDGWEFYGCFQDPYKGKWVIQIENCPLKEIGGDE